MLMLQSQVVNNSGTIKLKAQCYSNLYLAHNWNRHIRSNAVPPFCIEEDQLVQKSIENSYRGERFFFSVNAYSMYTQSAEATTVKNVTESREVNRSFKISSYVKPQGNFYHLLTIPSRKREQILLEHLNVPPKRNGRSHSANIPHVLADLRFVQIHAFACFI